MDDTPPRRSEVWRLWRRWAPIHLALSVVLAVATYGLLTPHWLNDGLECCHTAASRSARALLVPVHLAVSPVAFVALGVRYPGKDQGGFDDDAYGSYVLLLLFTSPLYSLLYAWADDAWHFQRAGG